ncbi:TPA: hypothetical protein DDW35_01510, partial [Candidatus Sumerlaeota bacterium]|nr:hypothetical protein [Candidatus Sumerlaeota bacterium]
TAIHLYRHLIKTDPTNPKWTERLQFCDQERGKAIAEAEAYHGWGKDCTVLVPVAFGLGAILIVWMMLLPEFFDKWDAMIPALLVCVMSLLGGIVLLVSGFKRARIRSKKIHAAQGSDYLHSALRTCWSCGISTVDAGEVPCKFCDAPKAEARPASESSAAPTASSVIKSASGTPPAFTARATKTETSVAPVSLIFEEDVDTESDTPKGISRIDSTRVSPGKEVLFCKNCGKKVVGGAAACTNCGVPTNRGAGNRVAQNPVPKRDVLFCRECGKQLHPQAAVCVYCGVPTGKFIGGGTMNAESVIPRHETFGIIALLLPLCSSLLAYFWVGSMNLLADPASKLSGLAIATVLLTCCLMAIEANEVGAGSQTDLTPKGKRREGPVAWFLAGVLLWAIAFPYWMHRRSKYGLKNLCIGAILVSILFVCVFGVMSAAIEKTKSEVRSALNINE